MKINNTDNEIGEEDEIIPPFCFDNVHMGTLSNDDRSVCKSCLNNVKYGHQPHLILEIIKETAYCFQHCCSKIAFVDLYRSLLYPILTPDQRNADPCKQVAGSVQECVGMRTGGSIVGSIVSRNVWECLGMFYCWASIPLWLLLL